jgi:hypothetical protein
VPLVIVLVLVLDIERVLAPLACEMARACPKIALEALGLGKAFSRTRTITSGAAHAF